MSVKGKKAWTREEIWTWFRSVKPPKRNRRPKGSRGDYENSRFFRCVLEMDPSVPSGRLLMGIWRGREATPRAVYYMTGAGGHFVTVDGRTWTEQKHEAAAQGYSSRYSARFEIEREGDGCRDFLVDVCRRTVGYDFSSSSHGSLAILDEIEARLPDIRRENARRRKLEAITAWADGAPGLPADLDAWLRAVPFGGAHYQFFSRERRVFGCSSCGAEHPERAPEVKAWRRGATVVCPACGVEGKVIRHGSTDTKNAYTSVMVVSSYRDRKGEPAAVALHYGVSMMWSAGREHVSVYPKVIVSLPKDGRPASANDVYYRGYGQWTDNNPHNVRAGDGYCYPELSALEGTVYTGLGLEVAAAKGWRLNYNALMRDFHGDCRIEYLIKGGFRALVADLAERSYRSDSVLFHVRDDKPRTAAYFLGLDGQSVARLRQHNGGEAHLDWLRSAYMCHWKLPDAVWDRLVKAKITPRMCSRMMDRTVGNLSAEQVINYIEKQALIYREHLRRGGRQYSYGYSDKEAVAKMWKDTLEMGMTLKLDFSKSMNVRPPDLKARHDELVEIINAEKSKLEAEEAEARFPEVAPTCERIRATYEWSDGEHAVRVPTGVYDIQREGRLLQHCVAANERYIDRIARGESYILFLRRCTAPDTPWYTMEVEPGGKIRQLRTTGDDDGSGRDREEAKTFLREWAKLVRSRCSSEELAAAEIAREQRLRSFDELRAGGNIIRNGRLQGRLLVEVLEHDFRELNEDVG